MNSTWTILCFGALQARRETAVVERFRTQKTAALLALLALRKRARREELCSFLWPDAAPEAARNSLSAALSALRRELGDDAICADRVEVALAPSFFQTDVAFFDEALDSQDYLRAASLYRGHLLPGFYEEPLLICAREYEEKARSVFDKAIEELEARGEYTEAVTLARRALTLFPDAPGWHVALMRAHRALNQYDAALDVFKVAEKSAKREGELVSDAARHLARQIRREREAGVPAPLPTAMRQPVAHTSSAVEPDTEVEPEVEVSAELPANLPATWTRFFGREDEIESLVQLLQGDSRFVTLSGMGGTGKTRLVLEVIRRIAPARKGPVYFVSLASLTDAELLFSTIRDALRLPVSPDLPPLQQIVTLLKNQPTLLVLDNFEQLVESGASRLQELRSALPEATFIVTSRLLLNLPGECEWPVAPLPTPSLQANLEECPSSALFLDRARAARSDLELTPENAECIAQLCRRLDGIPLALELAAARIRVLSPAQVLERLEKQIDFLQSREHGIPERQRTLRATIAWSIDLLSPELQKFFTRLSVFRGGWSLEAAEKICALSPDEELQVLDDLDQLRLNSLLVTQDTPRGTRFRLLEILREWGAVELARDASLEAALRQRHFEYFATLIEGASDTPSLVRCRAELEAESDNFRTALGWALERDDVAAANDAARLTGALCPWWESRSLFSEGREWTLRVLRKSGQIEPSLRARLLCGAGSLMVGSSDFTPAQSLLHEALALHRARGDEAGEAFALSKLGIAMMLLGQPEAAQHYGEEALTLARRSNDPSLLINALLSAGWTYHNTFQNSETLQVMEELRQLARMIGEASVESLACVTIGFALVLEKRYDEANARCNEALQIANDPAVSNPWSLAFSSAVSGLVARESGDQQRALLLALKAIQLFHNIGTRWELISALTDCGILLVDCEEWERAATLFGFSSSLCKQTGYRLLPTIECFYKPRLELLHQNLDSDALQKCWARGEAMLLDEAIEFALAT